MPVTTNHNKAERQFGANLRAAERDERTDAEQLQRLVDAGHGHCREAIVLAHTVGSNG